MEPDVNPPPRPPEVALLAFLADLAGTTFLLVAAAIAFVHDSLWELGLAAAVAIYGLTRFIAAYGLRRMKRFGALLERISAGIWIVVTIFAAVVCFKEKAPPLILPLVPGFLIAVAELIYLVRIKGRLAGANEPGVRVSGGSVALSIVASTLFALLIAVIAPNLPVSGGRSKQKRTMSDMRTIATAWEARATDINRYNAAAISFPTTGATLENLQANLTPTYIKRLPEKDGWGHRFQLGIDQPWGAKEPAQVYVIISYGKDGKSQRQWNGDGTTNFDCDIVYSNGAFVQYPEGVQQQ